MLVAQTICLVHAYKLRMRSKPKTRKSVKRIIIAHYRLCLVIVYFGVLVDYLFLAFKSYAFMMMQYA